MTRKTLRRFLVIAVCVTSGLGAVGASPRSGPRNRPFTLNWKLASPPAPKITATAFSSDKQTGLAFEDGGTILRTEDAGKTWVRVSPAEKPQGNMLDAIFLSREVAIAAGETAGATLRSEDGGRHWTTNVLLDDVEEDIRALTSLDASTVIAIGSKGSVVRTEDAGKTWTKSTAPGGNALNAIHFVDSKMGIAVGDGGTILKTVDGGRSWKEAQLSFTIGAELHDVAFVNASTAVTVGEFGAILWTADAGKTWQRGEIGGHLSNNLKSVWVIDAQTLVIVGEEGIVLRSTDAGQHWQQVHIETYDLTKINFPSAKVGIAVGENGLILRTDNAGKNWKTVGKPNDFAGDFLGIHFATSTLGVVISNAGKIFYTEDEGKSWLRANVNGEFPDYLMSIAFAGPKMAVAVGDYGAIQRTEDGGRTWQSSTNGSLENLLSVAFNKDAKLGIAVGEGGAVLVSKDTGRTWQHYKKLSSETLKSVALTAEQSAVALGDDEIWSTADGGVTWDAATIQGTDASDLQAMTFAGPANGIAVGKEGKVLWTTDGGHTWQQGQVPDKSSLNAVTFLDETNGVAVGNRTILRTADAGRSWRRVITRDQFNVSLSAVSFAGQTGVSAGSRGVILQSLDGGLTWRPARVSGTLLQSTQIKAIKLVGSQTGYAVGTDQTILHTRDGGLHWTVAPKSAMGSPGLRDMAIDTASEVGIIVGDRGVRLAAQTFNYAPYIENVVHAASTTQRGDVLLDLQPIDDEGDKVKIASVEFRISQRSNDAIAWQKLGSAAEEDSDGHWRVRWSPSSYGIASGSLIEQRVVISDGGPPLATVPLNAIVYSTLFASLYREHQNLIWAVAGVIALWGVYFLIVLSIFFIAPVRLALAGGQALEAISSLADGGPKWSKALSSLMQKAVLPWFKRQPRVRRAWISAYDKHGTRFADLAIEVRSEFLKEEDTLDAWVERRLDATHQALDQLPAFSTRRTYIPIPVRLGDAATGLTISEPKGPAFRKLLQTERCLLTIVGGGGSGKTTLACAMARWAINRDPELRLASHPMLPVILPDDAENILDAIISGLRSMLSGDEELDPDLVNALLRKKRILVIVDALSEREPRVQHSIERMYGYENPINALIVTSRRDHDFGPVTRTAIFPQPIDVRLLIPFIMDYLKRKQFVDQFFPQEQLILAQRILRIVEVGGGVTVTPLLITLFVDAALTHASSDLEKDLPIDVPEVYLRYLERLNPSSASTPNRIEHHVMQEAAIVLSKVCLGNDLVPTDFLRKEAISQLQEADIDTPSGQIDRLIDNGVISERSVANMRILRFQLDPVAEYLAAIDCCRRLGGDGVRWNGKIAELRSKPGYPDVINGFLTALTVCYKSYRVPLKLAELQLPWST